MMIDEKNLIEAPHSIYVVSMIVNLHSTIDNSLLSIRDKAQIWFIDHNLLQLLKKIYIQNAILFVHYTKGNWINMILCILH